MRLLLTSQKQPVLHRILQWLLFVAAALFTAWTVAALFFDFPVSSLSLPAAIVFAAFVVFILWWTKLSARGVIIWLLSLAVVTVWWFSLKPTNDRNWQADVAKLPWATITGNQATIHNIRDFEWHGEDDFLPNWETKTVDLSQINGVDLFLSHWGTPLIAHAIVSFSFADGAHLAMSIEARKAVGQHYSAIRAFFRRYEVIYTVAEERDVVRVRTNYRGEHVYLYHTLTTPEDARALFRHYLDWMNHARFHPEWYNALTRNCATNVVAYLARANVGGISRWDWRSLLVGPGDKMLYRLGDLAGNLPFPQLKQQALIDSAAKPVGPAQDFSKQIRKNRAGF